MLFLMPVLLEIRRKLTFAYGCIFAARSHDPKYIHVKNTYMQMQIYTWSEQVYIYTGVYICTCAKLTFTYMQLRSHAQKYTRVQIIHICIICTPCVNQRM